MIDIDISVQAVLAGKSTVDLRFHHRVPGVGWILQDMTDESHWMTVQMGSGDEGFAVLTLIWQQFVLDHNLDLEDTLIEPQRGCVVTHFYPVAA